MKKHYLHIALGLLMALTACTKENGTVNSGSLVGKWQQTKLNLHETNGNVVLHDTTFLDNSFTSADFYQFNSDKTAVISKSGNFGFGGKISVINADVLMDWVTHYTYSVADSTLSLKITNIPAQFAINSNGLPYNQSPTIEQLDSNHLILRNVYNYTSTGPVASALITTSYFTKE